MKFSQLVAFTFIGIATVNGVSLPDANALAHRDVDAVEHTVADAILSPHNALEKRKGGGGKGGGGGGGGGGGKSSGGGGKSAGASKSSNAGGSTKSGSGAPRRYGGGAYYGGGAATPYSAGQRSPLGLTPLLLLPAAALVLFPGIWLYSVYSYPFTHPYTFLNQTIHNATYPNGMNMTLPVKCLCQEYSVCGCDDNSNTTYMNELIGNGSLAALNQSLVRVSNDNGNMTIVINGTLENGTTAPGGTDSAGPRSATLEFAGYWVMGAIVLYSVSFL